MILFYKNCRINHVFGIFENIFEIVGFENWKFEILEIENFEMNLKFENFGN